jgi:predicted DNA-binding transcriptional regulator AlpA
MTDQMTEPLWTVKELATYLNLSPRAVYDGRQRNPSHFPPSVFIGGRLRWSPDAVRTWVIENTEYATRSYGTRKRGK